MAPFAICVHVQGRDFIVKYPDSNISKAILSDPDIAPCFSNASRSLQVLESGDRLCVGESLWSPSHSLQLTIQSGHLVVFRACDHKTIWSTTYASTNDDLGQYALLQEDGNLVLFSAGQTRVWSSGTVDVPFSGSRLRLTDDLGVICLEKGGICLWTSGGVAVCDPPYAPSFQNATVILKPGELLKYGMTLFSKDKMCNLTMRPHGEVVLYRKCDGLPVFSIGNGRGSPNGLGNRYFDKLSSFGLTTNGNVELTLSDSKLGVKPGVFQIIANVVDNTSGSDLRVRDDCRMCLFKDGICVWTADAVTIPCPAADKPTPSLSHFTRNLNNGIADSSAGTVPALAPARSPRVEVLAPGAKLLVNESLWSPNRTAQLRMLADGNLVVFRQCDGKRIWSTDTDFGASRSQSVEMQMNGNLAMHNDDADVMWASGTISRHFLGSRLRLEDSGSLCIENEEGFCLWRSGGLALCEPMRVPSFDDAQVILRPGQRLNKGQSAPSKNGSCHLDVERQGDMVLYRKCDGVAIFSVRHGLNSAEGLGGAFISGFGMNENGNLVWLAPDMKARPFKDINKLSYKEITAAAAELRLRDDCQMCVYKSGVCLWMAHAITYPCPVSVAISIAILKSGQSLSAGHSILSPKQNAELKMDKDQGFVLRRRCDRALIWRAFTSPVNGPPMTAVMLADGNLVLYNSKKVLVWQSNTTGGEFAGADLRVNNDGTICIARNDSMCLWSSGGFGLCDPVYSKTFADAKVILRSGESLRQNQTVSSKAETCTLTIQSDGNVNVVRQCDEAVIFSIPNKFPFLPRNSILGLKITLEGNLQFVGENGTDYMFLEVAKYQLWTTSTGADLRLRNDCILCVYQDGACLWTSSGRGYGCPLVKNLTVTASVPTISGGSAAIPTTRVALANSSRQVLESGDSFLVGESLWSPSRNVELSLQSNGNLVVYRRCDNQTIWTSDTSAYQTPIQPIQSVLMEENGNLAIYTTGLLRVWSSGTFTPQFTGAKLRLDDTGFLCIYVENECLWKSGGFALCQPTPSPTFVNATVILPSGGMLDSRSVTNLNGTCNLTIGTDGNMMLSRTCDGAIIFSIRHGFGFTEDLGKGDRQYVSSLRLNVNGNLALLLRDDKLHTFKNISGRFNNSAAGADLRLRDDCMMCVFKDGACLWTAHAFTYPCPAWSRILPPGQNGTSQTKTTSDIIVGSVIGGIALIAMLAGLLILYRRRTQMKSRHREWPNKRRVIGNTYSLELAFVGENKELKAVCSEYIALLEITKDELQLGDEILGKGEFGIVYKALAYNLPTTSKSPVTVAAKILTGSVDAQRVQFISEVEIMLKCGRHVNIVNILGVVRQGRPCMLLEYCANGSLVSFLRDRRSTFYSHLDSMKNCAPIDQSKMEEQWLQACQTRGWDSDVENMSDHMLSTEELIKFAHQISRGMTYLTSRFIIHRDLAGRNILVTDGRVMKISDFGLARYGSDAYTVKNAFIALPVLWMPPDAILSRQFSEKSDVWSFGVVLWEMFSLGLVPFDSPDVAKFSAVAFAEWLLEGNQLFRPAHAPNDMVNLMQSCWSLKPESRSTFTEIWKSLDEMLTKTDTGISYLKLETNKSTGRLDELDRQILDCLQQQDPSSNGPDETDAEHYTPNDVYVEDGNLVLQTQRRLYAGRNYTSGMADTFGKVAFLYGTVEFRAKLPPAKTANAAFSCMLSLYSATCHAGIHCAQPYSIDFLSVEGENSASVTYGPNRDADSVDKPFLMYSEREYSVYKVHWTADHIVWYVDGEEIGRVTDVGKVPHVPMKLGLKMRVFQVDEEGLVKAADQPVGAKEFPAFIRAPQNTSPIICSRGEIRSATN
ncbi:Macrophage colony-stimulating factor 1 receptor 2 [Hypsibius exemplaris]|uniref:Macrophage colony-stimulating factor 1 receptor 2 n=1 Tax=Hypsibius exemplaris TaxID=2072580 RepID=A0A9X6NS58_HYPEX|nr:Macrophage colony-stimulating factor 1 receptor 2 [Hypsibius exemplaris]